MEWIGYAASAIIAFSLLITNVWWFRRVNLVGACMFCAYGFLIGSTPVALMNGLIALIDVFFIVQQMNRIDYFHYVTVTYRESKFLQYFLRYYTRDISYHFPRFFPEKLSDDQLYTFIVRNAVSVGVFSYHVEDGDGIIDLDYVIPAYRDLKNTRYLLQEALAPRLEKENIQRFVVHSTVKKYIKHIKALGFVEDPERPYTYILTLPLV